MGLYQSSVPPPQLCQKALRVYVDPAAYGAQLHTMELDSFTRCWYGYAPESVRQSDKPVPLVVCMHGRGGSAETFSDLSGMNRAADEHDFIVVFPETGVYQQCPNVFVAVSPWSAIVGQDHELVLPEQIDPAVPYMFLFGDND